MAKRSVAKTIQEGASTSHIDRSASAASSGDPADEVAQRVEGAVAARRTRNQRGYPAGPFEEALEFALSIYSFGSGQPVRRVTLFDHLGKSPDSSGSRMLITNASKYGLSTGGYQADLLTITDDGIKSVSDEIPTRERQLARIRLAIERIAPFKAVYDKIVGNKLPARAALIDLMKAEGVLDGAANEGVDTFIANLRFVGLLQTLSGADRVVSVEHVIESLVEARVAPVFASTSVAAASQKGASALTTQDRATFDKTCFYITPIGDEGSEARRHSDLFLGSIIEPALEEFGLRVVRADSIEKPGTITRQIFEYILRSRLVIADLSYHNPNVFYELALRHAIRLPVVQVIRTADKIPFDLNQMRTVHIDTTSIYTLLPRVEAYKSEIAGHVRRALEDPDLSENPLSTYYPSFKVSMD